MQTSSWTPEIIAICVIVAFAAAVIGYLVAVSLQGRKATELSTRLEQLQQTLDKVVLDQTALQDQLKSSESHNHQLQLIESRQHEQLNAANDTIARLTMELNESKAECVGLGQKLELSNEQYHETEKLLEAAQAEVRALKNQVSELRDRLTIAEALGKGAQEEIGRLKDELAAEDKKVKVLETTQYQREEHFREQMTQLADTKQSLTKEFENLANKIFEEKGKTFTHTSQASIDSLLKPFREQIESFQKRINEVHDASLQGNTSLNAEIKKVLDVGLQISKEANNLTSALKGDSQQRGAWGEAQLRRTLEMSGLVEKAHYEVQSSFKDAEGKNKLTDYLVKLPDGKHIIIDSKVSLVTYDRAVAAKSQEEYQLAMNEHDKAVRKHIDDLSSKDYTNLVGMHSPSFVLMFMPIEPAYIEALKYNKDLFEYGYKKGIVLVSHTTLIPILRTVSNLWMIERSNSEAREISERAGEIYNQVSVVAERLGKLGGTLNTASNHYNETVTALVGKQGLYGKVERFDKLSAKVSKTLPQLEPTHMDFETERLSLIVEPIEETENFHPMLDKI